MSNYVEYSRCGRCGTKLPGRWSGLCNVCMQTVAVEKQMSEQKKQYEEQRKQQQHDQFQRELELRYRERSSTTSTTTPAPKYVSTASGFGNELSAFLLTLPLSAACVYFVACMFAWVGKFLFWMMTFGYVFDRPFPSWIWYDWLNWIGF